MLRFAYPRRSRLLAALVAGGLLCACGPGDQASDEFVEVAAAASLSPMLDTLVAVFSARHSMGVRVSVAGTGQLYAQILNGAPFDVLLAADAERPRLLEERRLAVPGTRFVFAEGRLVFYAPSLSPLPSPPWSLLHREGLRLALANPRTAPYGAAAAAVLEALDGEELARAGGEAAYVVVTGENVGQAFQFVRSGAAEVGLVALGQMIREPPEHYVVVPADLHPPIRHEAALLARAAAHQGAKAFLTFLRSEDARAILTRFGYAVPEPESAS